MATVGSFAFANRGVITIDSVELGVVKDVELNMSAEHVPLYGWRSIKRQAVAKHTFKVTVKVGWCKIDPVISTFLPFRTGGIWATSGTAGTVYDDNLVTEFDVTAQFNFEDSSVLLATVQDVYFPAFPMKAAEGQWVKVDMTGEGKDIVWTN